MNRPLIQLVALTAALLLGAAATIAFAADAVDNATAPTTEVNQWGITSGRNNVAVGKNIPTEWKLGKFNLRTGEWDPKGSKNIKWVSRLGSQSYGNPVVADGKIFIGTNNNGAWLSRYPAAIDLGCLLAFDIKDGKFLWQHSSEKLPTGRVHDWPQQGICSAPLVEGKKLWFVTSRGEVRCLDTEGFHDGENTGPYTEEKFTTEDEADVIWDFDMMKEMGISQHNMCSCSVTAMGDLLFVNTSNGVDVEHNYIPAPDAPSFFVMDKNTKKILWTDRSPGQNILHGQWSSPTYGVFKGVPQVIFAGGDGWVYSFAPEGDGQGHAKLLWKFDANPKDAFYTVSGKATRNHIIATPVVYDGLLYVGVGEDPEHGEGIGHLWCLDPAKFTDGRDVSPELAFNSKDPKTPIAPKRLQAVVAEEGDFARPNPDSAVVWHFADFDRDGNKKIDFEETMHRTVGTVAIKDNILYIADFSGLFHCLDAKTGKVNWTYDMLAAAWGSPLIVEDKVYIGDEDGDVAIFRHSADPAVAMEDDMPALGEINMGNSVYSTPIVADNVLYIANRTHLFAIEEGAEPVVKPAE